MVGLRVIVNGATSFFTQVQSDKEPREIRIFRKAFRRYYEKGIKFYCMFDAKDVDPKFTQTKEKYLDKLKELYTSNHEFKPIFDEIVLKYALDLFKMDSTRTLYTIIDDLADISDKKKIDEAIISFCVDVANKRQKADYFPSERQISYAKAVGVPQEVIDDMVLGNLERRLDTEERYVRMGLECAEKHASSNTVILTAVDEFAERTKDELKDFHFTPDDSQEERKVKMRLWEGTPEFEEIKRKLGLIVNLRARYMVHKAALPVNASTRKPAFSLPETTTAERQLLDIRAYETFLRYYLYHPLENIHGEPDITELNQALDLGVLDAFLPPPISITTAVRKAFRDRKHSELIDYLRKAVGIYEAITFVDDWAISYYYWTLAEAYKREGSLDASREVLKKAINQFPFDYLILRDYGYISDRLGDYLTAISSFKKEYKLASNGLKRFGFIPDFFEGLDIAEAAQNVAASYYKYNDVNNGGHSSTYDWLDKALNVVEWSPPAKTKQIANVLLHHMERELEEGNFAKIRKDNPFGRYIEKLKSFNEPVSPN